MTHLVFGTGLVGGFIAGGLIQQGFQTRLLGREKHRLALRDGLILTELNSKEEQVSPKFWQATENISFNFIWLTVKCTSVNSSVEQLRSLVSKDTIIICCQNGFGSDQLLRAEFPNNLILTAIVGFNVAEKSHNHLHRSTDGSLVVESYSSTNSVVEKLNCSLLPTTSSSDILAERWAKLQLNLSNPVNALADVPTKTMMENSGYRKIIASLMRELLSVTNRMQLSLPKLTPVPGEWLPTIMRLPNWLYLRLAQKMLAIDPSARQSMWWDLSRGKKSEIAYLNQAVIDQAGVYGIKCPVNQKIVDLIKAVERGDKKIGYSAKQLCEELQL